MDTFSSFNLIFPDGTTIQIFNGTRQLSHIEAAPDDCFDFDIVCKINP